MMHPETSTWPARPEFTAYDPSVQLFDLSRPYFEALGGPIFPESVALPIGGIPTEDGMAIFGRHFEVMAQREREWTVAGHLFNSIRIRLESEISVTDTGEVVLALPREDFDDEQNKMAEDGMINRGLATLMDRSEFQFPGNVDSSRDLPRFARKLDDGTVELVQELEVPPIMINEKIISSNGIFVAVKRIYGVEHQAYERDVVSTTMTLSPGSVINEEHQEYPALIDTYGVKLELEMSDDAIVERLNGQRPRSYDWGVVR